MTEQKQQLILANELRIGNYVLNEEQYIIAIEDGYDIEENNKFEPIPLTEEILLKCEDVVKHKSISNRYILKDSNIQFSIKDGDWNEPSLDIIVNGTYVTCVEFLHQFQNVMFSIIQEELNIEL